MSPDGGGGHSPAEQAEVKVKLEGAEIPQALREITHTMLSSSADVPRREEQLPNAEPVAEPDQVQLPTATSVEANSPSLVAPLASVSDELPTGSANSFPANDRTGLTHEKSVTCEMADQMADTAEKAELKAPPSPIADELPTRSESLSEGAEEDEDGDIRMDSQGVFDRERSLWNISSYEDRNGKLRAKRVLRFVTRPVKRDVGIVNAELAAELDRRRGHGRWAQSRADSAELKRDAQLVADAYWRDREQRNSRRTVSKPKAKHAKGGVRGAKPVPETQKDLPRAEMSDLLKKTPRYIN